jgi:hypothetical protein
MLKAVWIFVLVSDQLYNWSDESSKRIRCRASKTAQRSCASTPPTTIDSARFPDRAIQTLWQAGMQMHRGSRTWPQVLPVHQLPRPEAADGLCAAGSCPPGGRVSVQLSSGARDPGPDLRDQPRVAAPARGALKGCHERIADSLLSTDRCRAGGRAVGEHAGRLARGKPRSIVPPGGRR